MVDIIKFKDIVDIGLYISRMAEVHGDLIQEVYKQGFKDVDHSGLTIDNLNEGFTWQWYYDLDDIGNDYLVVELAMDGDMVLKRYRDDEDVLLRSNLTEAVFLAHLMELGIEIAN